MASQEDVQNYLQHHNIGLLFEGLMTKLINDQPGEPICYLARVLQLRADRKDGKSTLHKSVDFDSMAVSKKPGYDRPWQSNSKRLKPKDSDAAKTVKKSSSFGASRRDWDPKTKTGTSNLEDIWGEPKTTKKRSTSPNKTSAARLADSHMEDGEEISYMGIGYRGPQRRHISDTDPLAGEMGLGSSEEPQKSAPTASFSVSTKRGGANADRTRQRAALQQYIRDQERDREQKRDSGIDEEQDFEQESAIDLLEDADDLRREGVTNVKSSGVRLSRNTGQSGGSKSNIKVSICARCASVMGGVQPSFPATGAFETNTGVDTERDRGVTFGELPTDDEEFESVSQVNGPRRPVWQDSDNEVTPRKGKNMLASNLSPSKGLPMFSPTDKSSSRSKKGGVMRSDDLFGPVMTEADADPLRRTWSPAAGPGADYSEKPDVTARSTKSENKDESLVNTGRETDRGWQVPPDYDTDSSFYGSPGAKQQMKYDRAY